MATDIEKAPQALQELVAETDTGGRKPTGFTAMLITGTALAWALFQLWYASPLPFALRLSACSTTPRRARIHLAFALFLAFLAWPAVQALAARPRAGRSTGCWRWPAPSPAPTCCCSTPSSPPARASRRRWTSSVASVGLVLLLEATRRAVGWPMAALAVLFIAYAMLGPYMPEVLQHKGASLNRLLSHMWLTTEGVYGIALGVSTGAIFVYVLFGTLLDRAGGGNYMMQVSFAALGHLRGGPAKVAVVSSALNGMISGSSVSQRGLGRHLHHPADEEGRLRRRQGRRDRDHELGQRPDHAAGDGRGRLPDGRVRRHPVLRHRQARAAAGGAVATSGCSTSCTSRR